jgi:hypothetical protein
MKYDGLVNDLAQVIKTAKPVSNEMAKMIEGIESMSAEELEARTRELGVRKYGCMHKTDWEQFKKDVEAERIKQKVDS